MPASLRRLCVQIRAECLARMERDRMKPDEYDGLRHRLRLRAVIVALTAVHKVARTYGVYPLVRSRRRSRSLGATFACASLGQVRGGGSPARVASLAFGSIFAGWPGLLLETTAVTAPELLRLHTSHVITDEVKRYRGAQAAPYGVAHTATSPSTLSAIHRG